MNTSKPWLLIVAITCIILQILGAENNCPMPCPHIMDPVCVNDGGEFRSFSNRCLLRAHNECEREADKEALQEVDSSNCEDYNWR
ncbi:enhancer of split M1 protein [Topomyia yanbarensis]|uniref:enhancer of split M1 protein n=1 Tax=Topomyia yanbarensis TaxID=2498891 RepID=UPI00273AA6D0|nr:enhancer of split M1 protein [Topomyia yanbarensis]